MQLGQLGDTLNVGTREDTPGRIVRIAEEVDPPGAESPLEDGEVQLVSVGAVRQRRLDNLATGLDDVVEKRRGNPRGDYDSLLGGDPRALGPRGATPKRPGGGGGPRGPT